MKRRRIENAAQLAHKRERSRAAILNQTSVILFLRSQRIPIELTASQKEIDLAVDTYLKYSARSSEPKQNLTVWEAFAEELFTDSTR